jgi:hypothetical protein
LKNLVVEELLRRHANFVIRVLTKVNSCNYKSGGPARRSKHRTGPDHKPITEGSIMADSHNTTTAPAQSGGAMPESRSKKPNTLKMADELEKIKELIDVAYMAAGDLQDYQRGAMRGLLDQTSEKIAEIVEAYSGGDLSLDVVADMLTRKAAPAPTAPEPIARQAEASSSTKPPLASELLHVVDEITHVRYAIHAAWMASAHLDRDEHNAMQGILGPAFDKLTAARDRLNVARGAPERKAA